jgi:hypothetical protein
VENRYRGRYFIKVRTKENNLILENANGEEVRQRYGESKIKGQ